MLPLLYADGQLTGVLFETSKSSEKSEETVLGAIMQPTQIAFALLIGKKCMLYNMLYNMLHMIFAENLDHFELDQPEYCIASGDYSKLPLFHDNKRHKRSSNEFLVHVFFQGFVLEEHHLGLLPFVYG